METKIIEIQVKDSATPAINKINKNLEKTDKQVAKTGKTANKSFDGLNNTLGFMPKSIQGVIGGLKALKVALISTGIGALVVAAGSLVTLFISATKKGSEFASQLSKLRAVSGASNEEMDALSESAKKLGSSTQFTAVEVAQLQTEYAKLGKTTPEILAATEATLDLAASLEVGLAEAATLAGSVVNSFGLQASDTQRVVDVLAKSTSSSSLDFNLLTESLKLAAPIARATGKSIEETAGLLGVLADNGVKGSLAGTGLSKVMSELNKKGLTFEEAYSKVNNSTDKLGVAQELVGEIGAKSLLNLANSEEAIGKLTTTLENSGGAAKAMADIRLDNLEGDTKELSSAWEGFLLSLEDGQGVFSKISRFFVQALTGILNALTFLSNATGAFFSEMKETASVSISIIKTSIKKALRGMQDSFLSFKEAIADIPFIGKVIDKDKLAKDRKALNKALSKANDDAKYWADISKKRAEEGTFMDRVSNRLKVSENKLALKKISKNEAAAAEKQAKLDEEAIKKRKEAYAKFLAFRNKLEKRQEDFDDKTEEQKLARQKERDLKELDALKVSSKKKAEARLLIDKFYADKLIELEEKKQAEIDKKAEDARLAKEKKEEAARLAAEKKAENERLAKEKKDADDLKKFLETKKGLEDQYANSLLSNIEQEQNAVKSKYDNLIQQAIIYGQDTKILEEARQSELQEIEKDFAEQNRQARLKEADSRLEIASQATRAVQSLGDAVFAHRMKNLKEGTKEQLKAAKQQFNFNKALQLGMAVIDTGKAITASLAQSPVAIGPIPNPAGIASLAFAAISGASQIAMIASQKYEAPKKSTTTKSPPSIGGGGASASQAPNFNVVGQSGFNQVAGALGSQPPAQAFVVSGDITTAQQLENNTIQQATF